MTALKLFVSHSSRLDDQEHDYADDQANWRLLREVCDALEARCQDSIQLLVDWSGLTAGDDWNRELNLWLAECHAAVVLVSKRALKRSDWVAKEASILGWRRALDPSFLLIPVLIAGESTKRDLATGFFGSLDMDRIQCVDVPRSAQAIVDGIAKRLGAPADLAARRAQTPLELLQGGIAHLLAQTATEASLETAAVALGCTAVDPRVSNRERFAEALAKQLFQTSLDAPDACFLTCRGTFDHLAPRLAWERAQELMQQVRALWVHPGAAAYLPTALEPAAQEHRAGQERRALALCGQLLTQADDLLGTEAYTLERYLQRAWPGKHPRCVPIADARGVDQVRAEIRRRVLGDGLPPILTDAQLDNRVNGEPTAIVVILRAADDGGGLPDPRLRQELMQLTQVYHKLVLVFACCASADALPATLRPIEPRLDPDSEAEAFLAERAATTDLHQRYGRRLP